MISVIESIEVKQNEVYIRAIVEDMVEMHPQTLYDPAEYGPALCEATFELSDGEVIPENEDDLIEYLESLSLEWSVVDCSDYNFSLDE